MPKQPGDDYATSPPSSEAIKTASNQAVFGEQAEQVSFGDLIKPDKEGGKVIVIFIRHFHCGLCQEYIEHLSKLVKPTDLEAKGVKLFIIGCDPNRNVQTTLGMTHRTLDRGSDKTAPSHSKQGVIGGIFTSLARAVQMGNPLAQSGDIQALGGELVVGSDGQVIFSHRMINTRDHTEVHELLKHAGVEIASPAAKSSKTATSSKPSTSTPAAQPAAAPVAPPQAAVTSAPPAAAPAPTPAAAAPTPAQASAPTAAPVAQTAPEASAVAQPSSVVPTSTIAPTPTSAVASSTTVEPKEGATARPPQTSEPKLEPIATLPKNEEPAAAPAPANA